MKKIIKNTQLVQKELYPKHKIIYVLWDMREIWEAKVKVHENITNSIFDADAIFTVWPDMYQYTIPKIKEMWYIGDLHSSLSSREIGIKLKKFLREHLEDQYIILFKWSQNTIFTEEALAPQLLVSQRKNLPRQSEDWKRKKDEFFKSL